MVEFSHPCVVVGVEQTVPGFAALRAAVAEARRRRVPLVAVRSCATSLPRAEREVIVAAFLEALGRFPADIDVYRRVVLLPFRDAVRATASDPRDLIVVASPRENSWRRFWTGSPGRGLARAARCPVLAVPAPEMARALDGRKFARSDLDELWAQFDQTASKQSGQDHLDGPWS